MTLEKTIKVLDKKHLKLKEATFKSALRPLSGDDLPIIGELKYRLALASIKDKMADNTNQPLVLKDKQLYQTST